jgi:hypothetical protein
MICGLGDSRTQHIQDGSAPNNGYAGNHWITIFNDLIKQPLRVGCSQNVLTLGISGDRSDQYIQINGSAWLSSPAGWLIMGEPCVNDIGQASGTPYTNVNGVSVTISNVAAICAGNVQAAVSQAIGLGHKVFMVADPGSTSDTSAQVTATLEVNRRNRDFCTTTPGCYWFDYTASVWNPTNSATAFAFKANYSSDGTHLGTLGEWAAALAFQTQFGSLFPSGNRGICNIAETNSTSPLSSGAVAANWTLNLPSVVTATITYVADPAGCGSDMQIALTATGSGTGYLQSNAQSAAASSLTDINQCTAEVQVASGSSNFSSYLIQQNVGNSAGQNTYDLYPLVSGAYQNWPTTAIDLKMQTYPSTFPSGNASVSYVLCRIYFQFSAAGSATWTVGPVDLHKRYIQP